jgi:hypothetical protein
LLITGKDLPTRADCQKTNTNINDTSTESGSSSGIGGSASDASGENVHTSTEGGAIESENDTEENFFTAVYAQRALDAAARTRRGV